MPEAVRVGIAEATNTFWSYSRRLLKELIYNKSIPRRAKSGKPSWRRTYKLLNAERMAVTAPWRAMEVEGQVFTDPASPAFKYAARRHELKSRPAPWRAEAIKQGSNRAMEKFRKAIRDWAEAH